MTKTKIFHTQLQAPSSSLQMSQNISQLNILRKWRKLKTTRRTTKRITIFLLLNIRLYEEFSVRSTCLCISLCHILWEYFSFPPSPSHPPPPPSVQQPGLEATQGWLDDGWNLVFSLPRAGLGWVGVALVSISSKYQILYSHYVNSGGNDKYFDISILDIIGW